MCKNPLDFLREIRYNVRCSSISYHRYAEISAGFSEIEKDIHAEKTTLDRYYYLSFVERKNKHEPKIL